MNRLASGRHSDRVIAAIEAGHAASSALVASWQRSSALHHLDPTDKSPPRRLDDSELWHAQQKICHLLHAAKASLDRLYLAVGGIGCCVLLANSDGVSVERRGAISDDVTFRKWGLWTGTVWSEKTEGTNGIGTCLVEHRALTIHRDQHFFSRNTLLSCTTAPIYDQFGKLAAVLDVSSCRADLTNDFVNLIAVTVGHAAREIEATNFRQSFSTARILVAPEAEPGSCALLAIDADGVVVGATRAARLALRLPRGQFTKPISIDDVIGTELALDNDFARAQHAVIKRALLKSNGNVSRAAKTLGVSRATLHRKLRFYGMKKIRKAPIKAVLSQDCDSF